MILSQTSGEQTEKFPVHSALLKQYHLFSIIYASVFFAVPFVVTFERLAKIFQS